MKMAKKFGLGLVACVTACSLLGVTACSNLDDGEDTLSEDLSADVTVSQQMTDEDLNTQIARFDSAADVKSATLNGGVKLATIDVAKISAKLNVENAYMDATATVLKSLVDGSSSLSLDTVNRHAYMRGDNIFVEEEENQYTYYQTQLSALTDYAETYLTETQIEQLAQINDMGILLKLANTTDSITVDSTENTITLDVNGMIYGFATTVQKVVNNITKDTTVNGLLKCSAVKYYIDTIFDGVKAKDVYETIIGYMGDSATTASEVEGGELAQSLMPTDSESVYEYIVRLLSSEAGAEFGNAKIGDLLAATGEGQSAAEALSALKKSINDTINDYITATSLTIPTEDYGDITVSSVKVVYSFSEGGALTGTNLTGSVTVSKYSATLDFYLTTAYSNVALADSDFADISDYKVVSEVIGDEEQTVDTTIGAILQSQEESK